MRKNQDWSPFYAIAQNPEFNYFEKLDRYAKIADERFETTRFEEWCAKNLGHLDEVTWEFFGTDPAKDAVRQKVAALFPAHEVEQFTELFWSRIQQWRKDARVESLQPGITA